MATQSRFNKLCKSLATLCERKPRAAKQKGDSICVRFMRRFPHEITWNDFLAYLGSAKIESLQVYTNNRVYVKMSKHQKPKVKPYFRIGSITAFESNLAQAQAQRQADGSVLLSSPVNVVYKNYTRPLSKLYLLAALVLTAMMPVMMSMFRRIQETIHHLGMHYVRINYDDVVGCEQAKQELKKYVKHLRGASTLNKKICATVPTGVIITGLEGTGKTLLANATAGEATVPVIRLTGHRFCLLPSALQQHLMRFVFYWAKINSPCVVLLDELATMTQNKTTMRTLASEMDSLASSKMPVVVIGATSRHDKIDLALRHKGRFEQQVVVPPPALQDRRRIFEAALKNVRLQNDRMVLAETLATKTPGLYGGAIINVCNEARWLALHDTSAEVQQKHFESAIERLIEANKTQVLRPKEKRRAAYHEAGHTVCAWYLPRIAPVSKVSIVPLGKNLGYTSLRPHERYVHSHEKSFDELCFLLAGRVAEQIIFNEMTSSAHDDLRASTRLAYTMVSKYGFDDQVGPMNFDSHGSNSAQRPHSDTTSAEIDQRAKALVLEAEKRTYEILEKHKRELERVADALIDHERIYTRDLEKILGKRPQAE